MFKDHEPSFAANFIESTDERRIHRQTYIVGALFAMGVALLSGIGAFASYRSVQRGTTVLAEVGNVPVIADIRRLVFGTSFDGRGEKIPSDRMNILLLGIGGEGHDGAQLTDTIILASINMKDKQVSLLSIPRDTAYPLGGGRFEKINAVQAYAEQDYPGEGARRAADALAKLLEIDIHHVVRIDFSGFARFVDAIGGVDVTVERSFVDPQFPTPDDRWTMVSFKKGPQHFSGDEALTFARSRHGNNGEGSDFARSHRQQLIMMAIREKLLSLNTLTDPTKLSALYSVVSTHIQTDLTLWDMLQLAPLTKDFSRDRVSMHVLTDAPDGELTAANVAGAFMLFPNKPDWSEIRDLAQNPFRSIPTTSSTKPVAAAAVDTSKIEIKNGTTRTGFASQVAAKLERSGYEIVAFGNAIRRGYERTVIYDLTNGKKSAQLAALRRLLQADVSTITPVADVDDPKKLKIVLNDGLPPERLASNNVDFVLILGEASYALVTEPSYASSSSTRP